MSDSGGGSSLFGAPIRLLIFLVLLVISSPFLAVGYYKNSQMKSSIESGLKLMQTQKYMEAQQKLEDAADSLGVLYDCYVMVLPIVGGTYYEKKSIFGLRGVARALAIGEKMGAGDFNVAAAIEEAEGDITTRGSFPPDALLLKELGNAALTSYRVLLAIHADCEKGEHAKAFKELKLMIENSPQVAYNVIAMPVCYLLHQIAINLKTADSINTAKTFIKAMRTAHEHPLFVKFALAIDPIVPPSEQPRQIASNAPQTLNEKYQLGLAHAKRKDFAKAEPILDDCYSAEPGNDVIAYTLAMVKRKMGQNAEAKKLCEEILQRSPDDERANKLLAALSK
ncbi:MAG: tetratricopeptide repeat protein [Candidatus Riflebacteria bacterium]|nr:tetratricopeptide repeat protein [Candidatus Riflebacteria bacterium]